MKTNKLIMALMAVLALCSCGGSDGGSSEPESPKTYSQSLNLGYEAAEQDLVIDQLQGAIATISGATAWLEVTNNSAAGKVSVHYKLYENVTLSERKTILTVTLQTGDKAIINVTQAAHPAETNTDVDGTHDNTTDQPAYAPQR